ncbi:hypothetical protein SAMN05216203_3230 [Marinobacter daqiaonensis]|uniref:Uncharacterized protein n=1 Tax=Marinobacter daqiaonensis TaxID=650891 RepID=A0A1I6JSD5_9GAMM|nr:hypothetical protein SAMN05216203_3230 [Marinobacter daqiaonensis]
MTESSIPHGWFDLLRPPPTTDLAVQLLCRPAEKGAYYAYRNGVLTEFRTTF